MGNQIVLEVEESGKLCCLCAKEEETTKKRDIGSGYAPLCNECFKKLNEKKLQIIK